MSAPGHSESIDARPPFPVALAGTARALVLLAALALPLPGLAQGYESVFSDYRSHGLEPAATDWRDANRSAAELGGFVGQMRASPRAPRGPEAVGTTAPPAMTGMPELMKSLAGAAPRAAPGPKR